MATTVGTLLVEVIGDTSNLARSLANGEKLVSSFGSRMFNAGTRVAAGISLPVAAFMTSIAKMGIGLDKAMTESLAIMNDVSAEMRDNMKNRAIEMSKVSKFSAQEIAAGYYDLASAGFTAQESLDNIGTVTKFAQAGLMSMEVAGEHLTGAVNALGSAVVGTTDKAEAMVKVADVLTTANNNALGTVEDFSSALTTRFASGMRTANLELEEGVAVLMAFAQQNIKGREASQQAWMSLRDLQSWAIKNSAAFDRYGISVFESSGELRNMAHILYQLELAQKGLNRAQMEKFSRTGEIEDPLGKAMSPIQKRTMLMELRIPDRSVTALQKIVESGEEVYDMFMKLKEGAGETERVFLKQGMSIETRLLVAWHALQSVALKFFDSLTPVIEDFLQLVYAMVPVLDRWVEKFMKLDESTRKWILGLAASSVVLGPLMMFTGSFFLAIQAGMGILKGMLNVLTFIGKSLLTVKMGSTAASTAFGASWGKTLTHITGGFTLFWNLIKSGGILLGRVIPHFALWSTVLAVIGPSLKWITESGERFLNVLTAFVPPLALVRKFMGELGPLTFDWGEGFTQVKSSLGDLLTIFGEFILSLQLATLWVVKLLELAGSRWQATWDETFDMFGKGIDFIGEKFGEATDWLAEYIFKVPLLGSVFEKTFAVAGSAMNVFFASLRTHFQQMQDQAAAVVKWAATKMTGENQNSGWKPWGQMFAKFAASGGTPSGMADFLKDVAHQWRVVNDQMGGFEGRVKSLGGVWVGFAQTVEQNPPFKKANTFAEWLKSQGVEGADIPEWGKGSTKRDPVQDAYQELMGDGGRQWRHVAAALKLYKDEIYASEDAVLRLWEAYKKVRDSADRVPELEEKFSVQIAVENIERLRASFGELYEDLYGADNPLEKNIFALQDFVRIQAQTIALANTGNTSIFTPEFFEKHGKNIEDLSKKYSVHSMEIQIMIDEYNKWKAAVANVDQGAKRIVQSRESFGKIVGTHADTQADLKDKERELSAFRLGESDRVLRGLQKNYNAQVLAYNKMLTTMGTELNKLTGVELTEGVRHYIQMTQMKEEYLGTVSRLELERAAEAVGIDRMLLRSFAALSDTMLEGWIKIRLAANNVMEIMRHLGTAFNNLASVFDKGGEGTLSWLAKMAGVMEQGADAGAKSRLSFSALKDSLSAGIKDWKAIATAIVGVFEAVTQAIAVMDQATNSTSKAKNILGGAMAGAQIGGAIMPGWGHIIGAAVGAIVGALRRSGVNEEMKRVANEWGVTISEELAKTINDEAKNLYGGNRQLAELMNFGKILEEAGGLNTENMDRFLDKMHDFFVMVESGAMTGSQAMAQFSKEFGSFADFADKELTDLATMFVRHFATIADQVKRGLISTGDVRRFLDENFSRFVQNMDAMGGLASRAFNDMMTMVRQMGVESKAIQDFFLKTVGEGGSTWATIIRATTYSFKDLSDEIASTREEIARLEKEAAMGTSADSASQLVEAQKKLNKLLDQGKGLAAAFGGEIQRLGFLVLTTFDAALKSGLTWSQAMAGVAEALDELNRAFDTLGLQADNPALRQLLEMNKMFTNNRALFEGLDAMVAALNILSRLGALNQETFNTMNAQIGDMFRRTQDIVARHGGTHKDALRPIVPYLEAARRAAREYGFEIDANTQMLIDQAIEHGLMGAAGDDTGRTLEEAMSRVGDQLERMVELLQEAFEKMGLLARAAAGMPNLPSVPDPSFPGNGPTPTPAAGTPGGAFGMTTAYNVPRTGAYVAASANLTPAYDVPSTLRVPVYIDGRMAAEALVPFIPGEVKRQGLGPR